MVTLRSSGHTVRLTSNPVDSATNWPSLVGGNAALDFANTALVADGEPEDVLVSTAVFLEWAAYAGVSLAETPSEGGPEPNSDEVLSMCRTVRAAILDIATAYAAGDDPVVHATDVLRASYADALALARPSARGALTWSWTHTPPEVQALFMLTDAAVELFRYGALTRLKACESCHFVYLDASKNRSRRWCSMDDCGKQEKMQRYVARRAAARGGPTPSR